MQNNYRGRNRKREIPPINENIKAQEVRLVGIGEYGLTDGVYSIREARDLAEEQYLDLVLVSPKADPVVCKIMDYKKFKFDQEKNKGTQKKTVLKEMKLSPDIGQNDFEVKLKKTKEFIEKEFKVKLYIQFKGGRAFNEATRQRGLETMLRFVVELEDIASPDSPKPTMSGRRMSYMLSPKKKK